MLCSEPIPIKHNGQFTEPWQASLSYWTEIAHTTAAAHNLCNRLGIQLRKGTPGIYTSITPPIRRLVITGEDRPKNFALLFGPSWVVDILEEWKRIRADVLDTGRNKTIVDQMLDMGTPWYRPRAATASELMENETSEGGVRLERLSELPKANLDLSLSEEQSLEDWVDVLTIGESDTNSIYIY